MEENIKIVFSLKEVNDILNRLSDVPAKYSLDLITFIRAKAQEQVNEVNAQVQGGASQIADVEVVKE